MKSLLNVILILAVSIFTADAKGYSSSSRSYSSSSSRSSGYSSGKSSPTVSKNTPSGKTWSTTPQTSTRVGSKVEVSRYQQAVKSGKAFSTREAAVADFKSKNAKSFSSTFTSEPKTRPDYIPTKYTSGGKSYTVVYDKKAGGYGYWNGGGPGIGTWIMYDALSDAVMMNTLMAKQNYYVGDPVVEKGAGLKFILTAIAGVLIAGVTVFLIFKFVS